MRILTLLGLSTLMFSGIAAADDNIAACEIVIMKPVLQTQDAEDKPAMMASFLPADDFIFSVFSGTSKDAKEVDGNPIRGLMCKRTNVVPTEFDLKLVQTGVPLYLSQDFDSPNSALLSVQSHDGHFVHEYKGMDMSVDDKASLKLWLSKANAMKVKNAKD